MFLEEIFPTPIWGFDLKEDLDSIRYWIKTQWQDDNHGRQVSNVGGWQSHDYRSFEGTPVKSLTDRILKESVPICAALGVPESDRRVSNLWLNVNPKYAYNAVHVHPEAKLSGVFYVQGDEDSGKICFVRDNDFATGTVAPLETRFSSAEWRYPPKENRLLIFPSWVKHHVMANLSDEERISISFNVQ